MEVKETKEMDNNQTTGTGNKWILPAIAGALAVSLGFNFYQSSRLDAVNQQVTGVTKKMDALQQGLAAVQTDVTSRVNTMQAEVAKAKEDVKEEASKAVKTSSWAAQSLAQRHAEKLVNNLAKNEATEKQKLAETLKQDFATQVKETADQANTKIASVSTEVGTVKTEVASTRSELQQSIAELKRMNGDLGVMSGLIATNSSELKALRELGERNYFEFRIAKNTKVPTKVGDVMMALKKTDTKRSKFTMQLVADDKTIEKKDKTVNEPVQFYVASKARIPYEVVVNEVTKDTIVGYLSTPKVQIARK
jgi:predicted transcriptional regulator